MSKVMALALLMLLVETIPTTVLSKEVETLPTTYSSTHLHLTLPSTRRSVEGVLGAVEEGANKVEQGANNVGAAAEDIGEIAKQDVVDVAGKVSHATSFYIPSSYIITVILVYVVYV
ncbi:hypothetical protein MtrunA17_Chr4g0031011 [Medicago truncatula]|uniref:Transmembrane protein, putative n=1 Tax=Medicago truncatula TaxID=3880 RepID=G7JTR6_MEDTR|nr:transmembrane protein, putative [Medicago truncatula]RHN60917.1 hypothetical protein MtrunA17_Chr4g0031011 [Medicago truncatula]